MKIGLFNVTSTMDVVGSAEVGGVEAYTFRLAEMLQRRGHDVVLFGGFPKHGKSPPFPRVALKLGPYVKTSRIPNFGTRFRRLVQRLHFAWKIGGPLPEDGFDAVLIFKPYDLITAWAWRRRGIRSRMILSVHGPEFYAGDRWFSKSVDSFYGVSERTAKAVEAHYRRPCPVIPNFIDLRSFPRLDRPEPPTEKDVLAVGRLVGWKGMASLIRAFSQAYRSEPSARLTIVGDGPERAALLDLARSLGISGRVELTGILDSAAVAARHAKAWLFVQPSIGYESFSISALEALASGLSVLVSDQVGIADWFRGSPGIEIYPARDEEELAKRIAALLAEPWAANRERGRKGRLGVEREFDAERVVTRIEGLCSGQDCHPIP